MTGVLVLVQALFACTGLAGLMAWHIATGDRAGFACAAGAALLGYLSATLDAHSRESWGARYGGVILAATSALLII